MIATDFSAQLQAQLPMLGAVDWGDHRNNRHWIDAFNERDFTEAAVLVPVIDRPEGATVLLTYRSAALKKHAGQISFPGGKIDADDADPIDAALRELNEEVGLDPNSVAIAGQLPPYRSGSGFRIHTVVGSVPPDLPMTLNTAEVDATFEVPLAFLMDGKNVQTASRDDLISGHTVWFYQYDYQNHRIWGVTAGIINTIRQVVMGHDVATAEALHG